MLIGLSAGILYPVFAGEAGELRAMLNGWLIGFLGAVFIWIFEMKVFNPRKRTLSFIPIFLIKTTAYLIGFLIIILSVKAIVDSLFYKIPLWDYVTGDEFKNFILKEDFFVILSYTLAFLAIINFTLQMSRKVGYDMMINYITGKYHKPVKEERIFMFIDMKSSTTIAEQLGNLKYHNLLNDFYFDITKCILASKGEIYRYVGDEIDITWPMKRGIKNANCIQTYFYTLYQIKRRKEYYLNNYGFVPQFTTGLHCGVVSTGEIGEVKSQVVHLGDTIQTTNLLKNELKNLEKQFLMTGEILERIKLPKPMQALKCGHITGSDPKGNINLYTLVDEKI